MNHYWANIKRFLSQEKVILSIYLLAMLIISLQHYFNNRYNNFSIFRASIGHLLEHKNLYLEYPKEYGDLFLYHPTFPILFAPFSWMPVWLGMCCWTIFSSYIVFLSVKLLPISHKQKVFVWWFIFIELTTALHNMQTNPLIAAFIVLTFVHLEKENPIQTGFASALGFFIKGYGGISAVLFPFYPKKFGKNVLYYIIAFVFFSVLPGFIIGFDQLPRLYQEWQTLLIEEHKVNYGMSLIGLIYTLITSSIPVIYIQLFGVICLAIFLAYCFFIVKENTLSLRVAILANLLIWVIVFNHAAESSTHIISVFGVAFWYLITPKNGLSKGLLIFVLLLTILSPTDIVPKFINRNYIIPYNLKALPIVLVWLHLQYIVFTQKYQLIHEQNH